MTSSNYLALLPLIITGYAAVALSVIVVFWRDSRAAYGFTLLSIAAALGSIFIALPHAPHMVTPLIRIDYFSLYFDGLVLVGSFFIALFYQEYFRTHEKRSEGFYILLLLSVLGMLAIASSAHFASFFLGIETLSVSLYGMIGYTRRFRPSIEASMKYLILAAVSSAFLLFGIALVYVDFGTMDFLRLTPLITAGGLTLTSYLGLAMIIVGFAFKLAIVPFHMWSPDVYQGAPAPVTSLIATGSKGAVFALLLRLVMIWNLNNQRTTYIILAALAVATMFGGNLLALLETNVKRLLAYSSIAQIGYIMIPLIAGGPRGPVSIAFFLASYVITTIIAFGTITIFSRSREMGDVENLSDYTGLALRRPYLAALLGASLLSLTGLPPTVGFFAKFYIFTAAAQTGLWWLLIVGMVNSGIAIFYYMRVIFVLYSHLAESDVYPEVPPQRPASTIALTITTLALVFFGIYPGPLFHLAQAAMKIVRF